MNDPQFRRDLFRGAARDYDRFRVPYPQSLTDDLAERSAADGRGRLLDLACGTGQLAFALQARFSEVWAADQEPDMIQIVAEKARAAGIGSIRLLTGPATTCSAVQRPIPSPVKWRTGRKWLAAQQVVPDL